nr:site-specific integrase [Chitinivorax tropicus]
MAYYIDAATRINTKRSYQSAIRHYEVEWGGFLPATAEDVAKYLADHAAILTGNTLKSRLAALGQWHQSQGFPDPTKAPLVRKIMKGIRMIHTHVERQAKPLQLDVLTQTVSWLDEQIMRSDAQQPCLQHVRNKALLLLGFWRGFRSDELVRLRIEHIQIQTGRGMVCFLPTSKADRDNRGRRYQVPALKTLCPVDACEAWLALAGLKAGPLFRGVDRWGRIKPDGLHVNSIVPLLRRVLAESGNALPESYTSHSLRRGFANWAIANGWDIKTLMQYVGWRDLKSAMQYVDATDPFVAFNAKLTLMGSPEDDQS